MSQPPIPPSDSGPTVPSPASSPPAGTGGTAPEWSPPPQPEWTAHAPSWTQPWQPPLPAPVLPAAGGRRRPSGRLVAVLAVVAAFLLGAAGAAVLVSAAFIDSAHDIGQEIGAAVAPTVEEGISDGISRGMADSREEDMALAEDGGAAPAGPVQQFPAVERGELGPDPVLDAYADSCVAGDLQACDDLYYESPPLSDYEQYAATCAGRVKPYAVATCTDLD